MASNNKEEKNPSPKPGDMIECPRQAGYSHYGVYVGDGDLVHATSDHTVSGSVIKKEPLENVAPGGNFKVSNQDAKKTPLPTETILSQANARIGEEVKYRLLTNNCETIASEIRYGEGQGSSEQGEKFIQSATEAGNIILKHAKETHNNFDGN